MAKKKEPQVIQTDILQQKKDQLNTYVAQYVNAVSLVMNTIDDLVAINKGIEGTIGEIESYQAQLQETKNGLIDAYEKNDTVAKNFAALISK